MVSEQPLNVVTGAFGYTGRYIARRLLAEGQPVRTLTGHPDRPNPFGDAITVAPLAFDQPDELARSLEGAATLFNTYWVRFPYGGTTFDHAVDNTRILIDAARRAGVRRIVHVSVSNPSEASPLPYFRGKAIVEKAVVKSGLSYAIVRPTLIFGEEDILINNIAWLCRHVPVFAVPGRGDYRLQPVFVEDVAELAVSLGKHDTNLIVDAAGPEVFTFDECVRLIAEKVGARPRILHLSPRLTHVLTWLIGCVLRDVLLTRDELAGLMANLLVSTGPPTGATPLGKWLGRHADYVGRRYASELRRHYAR